MPSATISSKQGKQGKPCHPWPVSGAGTGVLLGRLPLSSPSRQLPGLSWPPSGRFSRAWHGPGAGDQGRGGALVQSERPCQTGLQDPGVGEGCQVASPLKKSKIRLRGSHLSHLLHFARLMHAALAARCSRPDRASNGRQRTTHAHAFCTYMP